MSTKSILDVIQEYGLDIKNEGTVLRTLCPFHNDNVKPNLTIYPKTNSYYCFACGESGDAAKFISEMDGITITEARNRVNGRYVDLTELKEMVDGLDVEDEEPSYNKDLNILVSKKIKACLQRYPHRSKEIFTYLKQFDTQLLEPISYKKMQEILKNGEVFFKKFV